MLSEMRRGEQAVNETLICARRFVANEQIDFERAGRKSGEHESSPSNERLPVGRRRRLQARLAQRREEETVDRVACVAGLPRLRCAYRLKSPMLFLEPFV